MQPTNMTGVRLLFRTGMDRLSERRRHAGVGLERQRHDDTLTRRSRLAAHW